MINVSDTTAVNGIITVSTTNNYTTVFAISNISDAASQSYKLTAYVAGINSVALRYRNMSDNSAVASTSISDVVLLLGY